MGILALTIHEGEWEEEQVPLRDVPCPLDPLAAPQQEDKSPPGSKRQSPHQTVLGAV